MGNKYIILSILGFKANQVHKKCVFDRNNTLVTMYGEDYLSSSDFPDTLKTLFETEKGSVTIMGSGEEGASNITIFNCNLEEELDNVSKGVPDN